ncbi:MAG TPA: hypothetical protein VMW20_07805 [Candidatus Nanoarchaeia archaeon]|nr:hypothetical protein [Candidatus Nanoarchaeia archaeon]
MAYFMDFERLYYYAVFVAICIPMAEIEKHLPAPSPQEQSQQIKRGTQTE